MGNLYRKNGDFSVALNYYSQAYDISYDDNYYEGMAYTLLNIGELYNDRKNKQKAIQHFENALKLAEKLEDKELIRSIYKDLSDAYATTSDFVKAYEYYKLYSDFMDELLADESSKKIAEMQNRYEIGKKEKEIELMEKQKELDNKTIEAQQAKNRKQQIIIVSSICGFLIVLVFSIIILRMFRQTRKANILLKRQNEEIRQQKEEIFIQRDEISAQRDKLSEQNSLLEEQKKEITDSINYAKRIQQAVLPTDEYAYSILGEHFILFKPKDIVSGDFYWGTLINEWLIVTVADCTGHGVPGAFMSMLGVSFLNEIVRKKEVTRACDVLNILREYIIEALQQKGKEGEQQDGMDIAFCAINSKTRVLQYAGAKNSLYIVSKDNSNEIKEFKADKMPVGIYMEMKPFTHNEICLNKDDIIYLSSDGYIDQFGGENRKKLLNKRFKEILLKVSKEPMNIQKEMLINEFENWKGEHEQIDDVTILGLKI
ncbi:MAG: SpoIIE family protein phosphatase [Bacteroidia bacterium]|nr:SpoIIE family protein phosphatase [Bacteroidia bacterium]